MIKKTKRGRCPFANFKECKKDCVFYRSGYRYNEKEKEPVPFEDCAINIIADNSEATHHRIFALQKEMGETKNAVLFQSVALLSDSKEDKLALGRMIKGSGGLSKLIGNGEVE